MTTIAAKQLLADATAADIAAVPDNARIGAFERWDSLAHMRLILAVEHQLGRQLEPDEIVQIETLGDVATLLNGHPPGE
jgi:acyl carrier protein